MHVITEFTKAVSDNTDGISKHRLSPYNARCLNYTFYMDQLCGAVEKLQIYSLWIYITVDLHKNLQMCNDIDLIASDLQICKDHSFTWEKCVNSCLLYTSPSPRDS